MKRSNGSDHVTATRKKPTFCLQAGQDAAGLAAAHTGAPAAGGKREEDELRNLILTMVDEPLAIVIKLADRLHNMRTVWALPPAKARAVATETLRVWCSLAERLGMFAVKVRIPVYPHPSIFVVNQPCPLSLHVCASALRARLRLEHAAAACHSERGAC